MSALSVADLRASRCVAIARGSQARHCAKTAQVLVESGIPVVEFPLTTPGVLAALPEVLDAAGPAAFVGVGSVVTVADAEASAAAGARFLVTPIVEPAVLGFAVEARIPVIAGAYTPTEISLAWQAGAAAVKVFPAVAGGPPLVGQLVSGPFPSIPLVPTGGVSLAGAPDYLRAGAVAVGLGSALLGDVLESGEFEALRARVAGFRASLECTE
ncbi:bifunctional 4-hydroxy-2-oxoglutarate aldolase/2-dehydro-3-deoxy-phosphogluconate aldolase [Amycolatopsis sp. CA-126428]|uniref:bifunctional 4-hydroxy-2-oxoglutarate aldolase/2-dehydro-3-deoxy-phosphogluconate aldolase n=1 Tax=Amycolatopsis sp. CA-126428 TaxID=2073158 RepID=UPI000CD27082|nr:bifunctional 4-hydroxy-2-oxoglutarate aldolase/2-dehydro-3-deoxy-phosphogluconate aldolase [Amycolatopsis sp. CA-126428]